MKWSFCPRLHRITCQNNYARKKNEVKQIQEDIDIHREDYMSKIYEWYAIEQKSDIASVILEKKQREK